MASQPPRLVLLWESLEQRYQVLIVAPILVVVLFLIHIGPLHQPLVRAVPYAIFWTIPATWAIVTATAHEKRKRQGGE
jgi:hypothetical protein